MKKTLFLAIVLLAPVVYAAEDICTGEGMCEDLPTCESLGYSKNRYCPEGYITCPFDTDYIWCKTYECGMGGYLNPDSEEIALKKSQGYICKKTKFHGLECYECDTIDGKVCRYDSVNKGEGTLKGQPCGNGKYPECESKCSDRDRTAEILAIEGAIPLREVCTACGIDEIITTDFRCDESYVKDEEHGTCVPSGCPTPTTYVDIPYEASGRLNCNGKDHPQGWRYETSGVSGGITCSRCVPKNCPLGSEANVSGCANDVGYLYIANGYSGDAPCGYCESLRCADPYTEAVQSISDCKVMHDSSWSASKAWVFEHSAQQSGDKLCGLCTPKECSGDYSKSYQSLNDCPNKQGYDFKYDTSTFYGDRYCGKCEEKPCPTGSKTDLALSECVAEYGSAIGTKIVATTAYSGSNYCQKCECDASSCQWTVSNMGSGGQGVDMCCDKLSYKSCTSTCEGSEVDDIPNAQKISRCTACGHTYLKVDECNYGYKIENNTCVQKSCADWNLKSKASDCRSGYKAVTSPEHPECYSCEIKTCADWGNEINQTWYDSSVAGCTTGYNKTTHVKDVGGSSEDCFDCEECTSKAGYITVDKESDIPEYVVVLEKFKSCDKYQYCAASCLAGYSLNGCACEPTNCDGYTEMSGLHEDHGNIWTDATGALKYELCQTAKQDKYKLIGCMPGYADTSCNTGIGEYMSGAGKDGYNCYKCACNVSKVSDCKWTAANMGDGKGSDVCCDGTTYKTCSQDASKCNYVLTEKPVNASEIAECTACDKKYYKVNKCKTGYKGETCSSCDETNGYGACNGTCSKKPNCVNGAPVCSSSGWVCSCTTGYTGTLCDTCNTSAGYSACNGACLKQPLCVHGTAKCESTGWTCDCDSCYKGTLCSACDDGCKDFGEGCVADNDCSGHGTYNGTECACDQCYSGTNCEIQNPLCDGDKPIDCKSAGYSSGCDWNCQNCTQKAVETIDGTLTCYEVSDKTCLDFCGKFDISTGKISIEDTTVKCNSIHGSTRVYTQGSSIYAWLNNEAYGSTTKKDNGCNRECYFDDVNCSLGEKLTETEVTNRVAQGYSCTASGYTPAGSRCYNCVNNQCPDDLTNEDEKTSKEAEGYYCEAIANAVTSAGKQCYSCKYDQCADDEIWSKDLIGNFFEDDFVSESAVYYQTEALHYCYKLTGSERGCSTSNTTYEKASECAYAISGMKDYGAYKDDVAYAKLSGRGYAPVAACHQCALSNGKKTLLWYPACRQARNGSGMLLRDYTQTPKENNLEYKTGSNCCFAREQNGDAVYETTTFDISAYKLGTSSAAQTCYGLDGKCGVSLVEDDYCTGTLCLPVDCSTTTYPYYNDGNGTSTIPAHATVSGDSCTKRTEACVTGPVYYKEFTCDTLSHVTNAAGTGCVCNNNKNGKGYYTSKENCENATRNLGHNCKEDTGQSDCWIQAECNGNGYYNEQDDCLEAETGHTCAYSDVTGCWSQNGCDAGSHYYGSEEACTLANIGHVCRINATIGCYEPSVCDASKGYYGTSAACKEANPGHNCVENQASGCFIKSGCINEDGYFDYAFECQTDGFACSKDTVTQCYTKTDCADGYKKIYKLDSGFECVENPTIIPLDCATGTYASLEECETKVMSGETCELEGQCYRPYCTSTQYNKVKERGIIVGYSLAACHGDMCRTSNNCTASTYAQSSANIDGYYHYAGGYKDGCLKLKTSQIENEEVCVAGQPCTSIAGYCNISECTEVLNEQKAMVDEWNNKCSAKVEIYYRSGSLERNCHTWSDNGALAECTDQY